MSGGERILRDIMRGVLAVLLLDALRSGPLHGYGLRKAVLARTGWEPPESSLYDALKRLEREGLVESYWARSEAGGLRKLYRLSPRGLEVLGRACETLKRALSGLDCEG